MSDQAPDSLRRRVDLNHELPAPEIAVRPPGPSLLEYEEPADPYDFGPENVQLTDSLPPNVALLCVSNATWQGNASFQLHFHFRGRVWSATKPADLALHRPPAYSLAEIAQPDSPSGRRWKEAYSDIMNWWSAKYKLVNWIRELLDADDAPQLIVWDDTGYEIPWELYYHRPATAPAEDDRKIGWLGELIPVMRWTTVHGGIPPWHFTATRRQCAGGLLLFEDPGMRVEPDGFAEYEIEARTRTMTELMGRLDAPSAPFGLLVIRCHGEYSRDSRRLTLGGYSLNDYTEFSMEALQKSPALVLLNACVSGRPVADERHPGTALRSFAELFLRYGASGVIATVGNIDLNHSHDFAVRLLSEAEDQDLNLAEALHRHRRYYANRVRRPRNAEDRRTEAEFEQFFSSFMYVYFGHPETTLRSRPRA